MNWLADPNQGYRYLSDSNLDWGQDLKGVKAYMAIGTISPIIYLSYFGTAPPSLLRHSLPVRARQPGRWNGRRPAIRVEAAAPRKMLAISVQNLQDVSIAASRRSFAGSGRATR